MTLLFAVIAVLLTSASIAHCQGIGGFFDDSDLIVSPGIRVVFGISNPTPAAMGFELSAVFRHYSGAVVGGVFNYDYIGKRKRVHIGIEGGYGPLGLDAGPTFFLDTGKTTVAATFTPYLWLGIVPFYSVTFLPDEPVMTEWGLGLKLPLRTDGRSWFDH